MDKGIQIVSETIKSATTNGITNFNTNQPKSVEELPVKSPVKLDPLSGEFPMSPKTGERHEAYLKGPKSYMCKDVQIAKMPISEPYEQIVCKCYIF